MTKITNPSEVRAAARVILDFIAKHQRMFQEDSWEYEQLNEYYADVCAFEEVELEL